MKSAKQTTFHKCTISDDTKFTLKKFKNWLNLEILIDGNPLKLLSTKLGLR
jgi:hypothetical protein